MIKFIANTKKLKLSVKGSSMKKRWSYKEQMVNALVLTAEEGRVKLR